MPSHDNKCFNESKIITLTAIMVDAKNRLRGIVKKQGERPGFGAAELVINKNNKLNKSKLRRFAYIFQMNKLMRREI